MKSGHFSLKWTKTYVFVKDSNMRKRTVQLFYSSLKEDGLEFKSFSKVADQKWNGPKTVKMSRRLPGGLNEIVSRSSMSTLKVFMFKVKSLSSWDYPDFINIFWNFFQNNFFLLGNLNFKLFYNWECKLSSSNK